ncbi:hypothetical protein CPAV1605_979 [seawater metagenome]|uniref:Uncharacterized protein n=1 Tax=seawater metagenome TaxID=1561972 RepID=A0A5E8CKL6_9ZZZZ
MKQFINNNNNCKINYVFTETNVNSNNQSLESCPKISYNDLTDFFPKDTYNNLRFTRHNKISEDHQIKVNHSIKHPAMAVVYVNWEGHDGTNKVSSFYKFIVDGQGIGRVLHNNSRGSVSMGLITKFNHMEMEVEYMAFSASLGLEISITETYTKTDDGIRINISFNHPEHSDKSEKGLIN